MSTEQPFKDDATIDSAPQSTWVASLTVVSGKFKGRAVEIEGVSFTIGRSGGNGLVLGDGAVSRRHAAIEQKDGHYYIYDLGSRWGVKLNGAVIKEAEIKFGDEIEIAGNLIQFGMVAKESLIKKGASPSRYVIAILVLAALIGTGLLIYHKKSMKTNMDVPGGDVLSKIIYHYDRGINHYNQMNTGNKEKHKAKVLEEMKTVLELDPDGQTQFSRSARRIIDGFEK